MKKRFFTVGMALAAPMAIIPGVAVLSVGGPAAAQDIPSPIEKWRAGDFSGAVALWRIAAAQGDADAAFNLGQAYRLGKGVPLDLGTAQSWYERAARKGHPDAAANLGMLLFQAGDHDHGIRWLKQAADAGEPRALLLYGTALYNGDAVAVDPVAAYAYVSRSAAQGLGPAKSTLADMDAVLPVAIRQKGVAMAQAMAARGYGAPPVRPDAPAKATARTRAPSSPAPVAPAPVRAARTATVPAPTGGGNWRIQLGAFGQRGGAAAAFARLGHGALAGKTPYYVAAGAMTRLQAGPYASRGAAAAACASLKGQACFPVPAP